MRISDWSSDVCSSDLAAPIAIGALQRHAVDHLLAAGGAHPFKRAADSGKRIAVVGAGPAGLAFAHRAAMLGHAVSVFDAKPKPGGPNEYGLEIGRASCRESVCQSV